MRTIPRVENPGVARILTEIADLLELKGENVFRVRAYRTGAQVVADCPDRVADMEAAALVEIAGIGKDLANRIKDIAATGTTAIHHDLLQVFPATILEVHAAPGGRTEDRGDALPRAEHPLPGRAGGGGQGRARCAGSRAWAPRRNR